MLVCAKFKIVPASKQFPHPWIPQDLGTGNILKYLSYVTKDQKLGEKVEALVFKIFWLRLQEESYFFLTPCYSFQMQPQELCSWARSVAGRVTLSACQSTWLKHITILSHNTSPPMTSCPSTICDYNRAISVLKDKSCGLSAACYLEHGHGTATHLWEGRESPLTLAPGISGGHTTFLLLRSKSQKKNITLNKMTVPSSPLFLHCAQELFWFCPVKCRLPVQRLINCYDWMLCPHDNSSFFLSQLMHLLWCFLWLFCKGYKQKTEEETSRVLSKIHTCSPRDRLWCLW